MKFIGQYIQNLIARFRNDVFLEDISTGTIASGGNLGLDANNKIVKADEASGDITGVTAGTNLTGGGDSGAVTINLADASTSVKGAASFSSEFFDVSSGAVAIKLASVNLTAYVTGTLPVANGGTGATSLTDGGILLGSGTGAVTATSVLGDGEILIGDGTTDPVALDVGSSTAITTLGTVSTGVWNGTAIATAYIADDAVTFAKASGVSPKVFGSTIKILPSDFMSNDDGGSTKFGIGFIEADGTSFGMKIPNSNTELIAFVSIPEGMKATHVDIFDDSDNRAIEVFEANVNSRTITSKGSGNCNTTLDITDVNATATNYLMVVVTTTATSDRTYGGTITIAAQ